MDEPDCSEESFDGQIDNPGRSRVELVVVLQASDIGSHICLAIDYTGGLSVYHFSDRITDFVAESEDASWSASAVRLDNAMIVRSNKDAFLASSSLVEAEDQCGQTAFLGGGGPVPMQKKAWSIQLSAASNGSYSCFKLTAPDGSRPPLFVVSKQIVGIAGNGFGNVYSRQFPTTVNGGRGSGGFPAPLLKRQRASNPR